MLIDPSIPEIENFLNLTLKIQGQGEMKMMLHNYRSRFHITSNGINPSSGFRDMASTKSGSSAASFDKFLVHGQAHMGQMGQWPWQCTTTALDNSTELPKSSGYRDMGSASLAATHPPVTTIPPNPKGWGVKTYDHDDTHQYSRPILGLEHDIRIFIEWK